MLLYSYNVRHNKKQIMSTKFTVHILTWELLQHLNPESLLSQAIYKEKPQVLRRLLTPNSCISEDYSCLSPGTPCLSGFLSFSSSLPVL